MRQGNNAHTSNTHHSGEISVGLTFIKTELLHDGHVVRAASPKVKVEHVAHNSIDDTGTFRLTIAVDKNSAKIPRDRERGFSTYTHADQNGC